MGHQTREFGSGSSSIALPLNPIGASAPVAGTRTAWIMVAMGCAIVWLIVRAIFFLGIAGSDDMYYMRFAAEWDRSPLTHWEARLVGNGLTALSISALGRSELAATLPSLLASGVILACVLIWCRLRGSLRYAWWAGLFTAVVPLDVELGTSISPHTIMAALMVVGTLAYLWPTNTTAARWVAAVCLSLGVVTHFAGVYYVAALAVAGLIVDYRRYLPIVLRTMIVGVALLVADMAVFHFMFGDAFCRFRVCQAETTYIIHMVPRSLDGSFDWERFLWPIRNLFFSKALGIAIPIILVVAWRNRRRMEPSDRIGVLAFCGFWCWISFGSEVPWKYVPFDRMTRFMHPALFLIAGMFAVGVAGRRRSWMSMVAGATVIATFMLNLLCGGSWGQNAKISRELLAYTRDHPGRRFVTDYHTLNEMYILNGVESVPNVATIDTIPRSRLLDGSAERVPPSEAAHYGALLINPLNVARTPGFAVFSAEYGGRTVFETEPRYRHICTLLPPLRGLPWAIRKPGARVLAFEPASSTVAMRGER
ncbi:MAG: hypothetical protein IIB61_02710 [Planctomycetes bacterium]|nr:hypothetical protein [Planctomycetota bacterium]